MNFLVYLEMRNYDLKDARADLAHRSARRLMKLWQSDRGIHENYNANTGAGNDLRSSDGYYRARFWMRSNCSNGRGERRC